MEYTPPTECCQARSPFPSAVRVFSIICIRGDIAARYLVHVCADNFPEWSPHSFNQQAYREAIIALLTRRRMPFSAVEWSEMKDLALACNPAIEDLLISSRRTAVRYIASNTDFTEDR